MNKILIYIILIGILMTPEVKANVYQFNFKSINGKENIILKGLKFYLVKIKKI